jgi:outer membrane protein TolC
MNFSIKPAVLFLSLFISACSQNSVLNKLQSEFNDYKYSSYVSANLNQRESFATTNVVQIPTLAGKLGARKKYSGTGLNSAIYNNGLFKSSNVTKQKIALVNGRETSENLLKNSASLDVVLALAVKNNLEIKSALQQAQANLEKYDQVGFLDDMLKQYAAFTKDIQLTGSNQKHKSSVNAGFPFPGLTTLKASIIDQSVESSRLVLKQKVQDVITQTRIAYYELQYAEQKISLTRQSLQLFRSLKEELQNNYSTNTGELSGILQADIQVASSQNKLQVARNNRQIQQVKLNALLNLSPAFTMTKIDKLTAEKLAVNVNVYIKTGQSHRIEVVLLQSEIEKVKRIIQLSEKRFYPDIDAGFSRFQNGKFTAKPKIKNSNFFAKNDAYLNETRQNLKALQLKLAALKNKTADEIQGAYSSYQSQQKTYALYRNKVIPKAKSSLSIAKNLYETGETNYVKIIDVERMILDYRLLSFKALKEMNSNKAKLLRLTGKR